MIDQWEVIYDKCEVKTESYLGWIDQERKSGVHLILIHCYSTPRASQSHRRFLAVTHQSQFDSVPPTSISAPASRFPELQFLMQSVAPWDIPAFMRSIRRIDS